MGIWARAPTAAGLFDGLARALTSQMTDLRTVRPIERRELSADAGDPTGLVVAFLTQLLDLEQEDGFLARRVRVQLAGSPPTRLSATAWGEPFDEARHPRRIEVKAATFHRLVFDPRGHRARVILDI